MNDLLAQTYNLVGSDDLSGPMLWIENWCGKNPLRGLAEASSALVHELYPGANSPRRSSEPRSVAWGVVMWRSFCRADDLANREKQLHDRVKSPARDTGALRLRTVHLSGAHAHVMWG
jgi:hypothetical protein